MIFKVPSNLIYDFWVLHPSDMYLLPVFSKLKSLCLSRENNCFITSTVLVVCSRPTENRPELQPLLKLLTEQSSARQQSESFTLLSSCWILDDFCVWSLCFQRTRSVEEDLGSCFSNMCCWGFWTQDEWTEALRPQCSHYPFFFFFLDGLLMVFTVLILHTTAGCVVV